MAKNKEQKIIFIDSQVLIWGVQQKASEGFEEEQKRAVAFLDKCFEENVKLMISTINLAEFLARIPVSERDKFLAIIAENCLIVPFDYLCAIKASELFQKYFDTYKKEYKKDLQRKHSRIALKDDIKIASIVIINNPNEMVCNDREFRQIIKDYINCYELPEPDPEQLKFDSL